MSSDLFQTVRDGLQPRLADVLADILPGGRIVGREYCCASLEGGQGNSCRTNLQNGVGSDFATGERWSDIISLAAQCWRLRPGEAARELARRYALSPDCATTSSPAPARPFMPLLPVPPSAPEPPRRHGQLGTYTQLWRYLDEAGRLLACVARFSREDGSKVILPLSYGREGGTGSPGWFWKALPEPRPLYGLHGLALRPEAPVLLVEGEKTADAAQRLFPEYAVLTWSGGANAVCRSAYAPLRFRRVTIWPDNDAPGFRAVCSLLTVLAEQEITPLCVLPPSELPEAWDLADEVPEHMDIGHCLKQALPAADFLRHAQERFPGLHVMQDAHLRPDEPVELELHSWPTVFLGSLSRYSGRICPAGHAGQRGGPGSGLHNGTGALLCGSLRACSQLRAAYPRRRNCPSAPSLCRDLRQFQQGAQGNLPSSGKSPFRTSVLPPFGFTGMETAFAYPGKQRPAFYRRRTGFPCPGGI